MSFASNPLHIPLEGTHRWASSRRTPRRPFTDFCANYRCLCRQENCPAGHYESGNVSTANLVAERLRYKLSQPVSLLARWIVDRQVIAFSCGGELLLPLFQFDFRRLCVRSGVSLAMSELGVAMTDDEIACWFALPNPRLNGVTPALAVLADMAAVMAAAREDRLVSTG